MITVIRFTHSTGSVDFYEDEFPIMDIQHVQKIDLFTKRTNKIGLYEFGFPYRIFTISFNVTRITGDITGTLNRIEDLFNKVDSYQQPEVMTFYYRYRENLLTTSCSVQMWRSDFKKLYVFGETRIDTVSIRFVESIKQADKVTVLRKIIVPIKRFGVVVRKIIVPIVPV